jgi:3-deoxy-manno-octulosonate cytidylyltransferase (CMP-KDO synthetase)
MKRQVLAVIPARLGSRRFSGKVLYPFHGKPLLFYVWHEIRKAKLVERLVIATDSSDVADMARSFGAEVFVSKRKHETGSDRVAEVARRLGGEIIINVQADNLGLNAKLVDKGIVLLKHHRKLEYLTLATPITTDDELFNPNTVKVVVSKERRALWFSRSPIPFLQHADDGTRATQYRFLKHVGVYFFRRKGLEAFAKWRRTPLEKAESLEQLRILEHGHPMGIFTANVNSVSVDSPEDMNKLEAIGV